MDSTFDANKVPPELLKTHFNLFREHKIKDSSQQQTLEMMDRAEESDDSLLDLMTPKSSERSILKCSEIPEIAVNFVEDTKALIMDLKADIATYSISKEFTEKNKAQLEEKSNFLKGCLSEFDKITDSVVDFRENGDDEVEQLKMEMVNMCVSECDTIEMSDNATFDNDTQRNIPNSFLTEHYNDLLMDETEKTWVIEESLFKENFHQELEQKDKDIQRLIKQTDFLESDVRILRKENEYLSKKLEEHQNCNVDESIEAIQKEIKEINHFLSVVRMEREELIANKIMAKTGMAEISGVNVKKLQEELATLKEQYDALCLNFKSALEEIIHLKSENAKQVQE